MTEELLLGTGLLDWPFSERQTDRYGIIFLRTEDNRDSYVRFNPWLDGEKGSLLAVVRETRESSCTPDTVRGFHPSTPALGERVELGEGTVFFDDGYPQFIGLQPDDKRLDDWLHPEALFRLHGHTVTLYLRLNTSSFNPLRAPWTPEQVEALNRYQQDRLFHPYTCGSADRTDERHLDGEGVLVATVDGWLCPYCGHTQAWAHRMSLCGTDHFIHVPRREGWLRRNHNHDDRRQPAT